MLPSSIIWPLSQLILLLTVCLMLVGQCKADGESGAMLIGIKRVLNNLVVKNMPITVQYDIYNIGDKAAVNVQLQEDSFPSDYFGVSSGLQQARWSRIGPGRNVSHSLILTPLQSFVFNISQATLRYKSADDTRLGVTVAHTTGSGEISVIELANYEKQFSAHATEWLTFGMMTTPSVLIPFLLWYVSMRKYTTMGRTNKRYN